jgi:hypothetical protein
MSRLASITSVSRVSLALNDAEPRINYQYVAGKVAVSAAFEPNKNGTLLLAPGIPGNKLTLVDLVNAILEAMKLNDPSAPPDQRAGFHSLSMRLDFPGVPYNLRSVFIDVGKSPVVADATAQTYAISAGRIRLAGVAAGVGEGAALVELLEALRRELLTWRDTPPVEL